MKLIARKPCSFGGKKFYIGEEIPAELVLNPQAHAKLGTLTVLEGDVDTSSGHNPIVIGDPTLTICVHVDGSDMELEPTDAGIQDIFNALISNADGAVAIVNEMTDEDALILLHMADSRKAVKSAAENRAKSLRESEGEQ